MSKVITENRGNIAILKLNNEITNAICPDLVNDFSKAFNEIKNDFEGMVLAGGTKFFCIGLDLPKLLKLNRIEMTDFWDKFNQLVVDIFTVSLPTSTCPPNHKLDRIS